MKVLYISSWKVFLDNGNVNVPFIAEQIHALSKHVEAIYLEYKFLSYQKWLITPKEKKVIHLNSSPFGNNISHYVVLVPKLSTRITGRNLWEDVYIAGQKVASLISNKIGRIDLIHVHTVLNAGAFALGLNQKLNLPIILQEHSAPFEMHLDHPKKRQYVNRILDSVRHIVPVGPFLAERMISFNEACSGKLTVIPEMIRTDVFTLARNTFSGHHLKLISIGGLVERKGYDFLIEAVHLLKREGKGVKLKIIGEGPYRIKLEDKINTFDLNDSIELCGHLAKEEINKLLEDSHIYVHSSLRETFGIAPTEAMLKGRPVVSTKCEGPEYYVNDKNGFLIEKGSAKEIVKGIHYILENFHDFDENTIRSSVEEKFGEEAFLNQMLSVYKRILNG